ncbi:MAG TPA: rod shape-determining protein RodA, partial [Phenylobacterium sp.]|nr:rod shape-determining protein RodA [Phenylobacterium sp.]
MTVSALTRPGERDRLVVKFGQIDWPFTIALCLIAGSGALMMFSVAGSSWEPWAAAHLFRFGFCVVLMVGLALVDLRVWFALAYPVYAV